MTRAYTSAKRAHAGEKPDFTIDGAQFVCEGRLTALDISELAEVAELGADTDDPRGAAALSKFMRAALGDREYQRLKTHMRRHETDDDVLIDVARGIMEDFSALPTQEPSRSQDGPSTTGPTSKVVSLQRGSVFVHQPGDRAAAAVSSTSTPAPSSPGASVSA